MAVSLPALASSRFALSRQGFECALRGALMGSVKLERFKDLFAGVQTLDCRDLAFASWSGVEALLGYLRSIQFQGKIRNIPVQVVESFLLQFQPQTDKFEIESAILSAMSENSRETQAVPLIMRDLKERLKKTNAFTSEEIAPGMRYVGAIECVAAPHWDGQKHFEGDARATDDAENFWFLYCTFLQQIVALSINHLETVAAGCVQNTEEILLRIEKARAALDTLELPEKVTLAERSQVTPPLLKGFEDALAALHGIEAETRSTLMKLQSIARKPERKSADKSSLLVRLASIREKMRTFSATADEVGVQTFSLVMPLSCGSNIKTALEGVRKTDWTKQQLESLSDSFFVLDPFAMEEWDTLLPVIGSELDLMDSMVMNLVVDVQGFDSVKQVIEKREKELATWMKGIEEQTNSCAEMIDVVRAKLVTVQERCAYNRNLSHLKPLDEGRVEGLDVNFF
jgi:hypothetical protein